MKKRALAAPFLVTVAGWSLAFADSTPPKEKLPKAPPSPFPSVPRGS